MVFSNDFRIDQINKTKILAKKRNSLTNDRKF